MKQIMLISFFALWQTLAVFSQANADDIVGYYLVAEPKTGDKAQMEIYRTANGKYEGKIVWVENKSQSENVGTIQVKNLAYDSKTGEWKNGKVLYDGGEYSVNISFVEPKKLKVRGYLGISLLGKTVYWTKEEGLRRTTVYLDKTNFFIPPFIET